MRKPYSGSTRPLVIALDVGTTFSGVSYTIMARIRFVTEGGASLHACVQSGLPAVVLSVRQLLLLHID